MAAPSMADHVQESVVKLPPNHRSSSAHETLSPASADRNPINNLSSKINRSSLKILHSRYVNVQSIHSNSLRKNGDGNGDGEGDDHGMLNILSSSATVLSTAKSDSRRSYSNLMVRPSSAIAEQETLTTNKNQNKNNSIPAQLQAQAQAQAPPRPKGLMKMLGSFLSSRKKPAASAPAPSPAPSPAPAPVAAMKACGNLVEDHNANSWSFKKLHAVTPLQQNGTVKATDEQCVVQKMVPKNGDGGGDKSSDLDHGNPVPAPNHAALSNSALNLTLNSALNAAVTHPSEGGASSSTVASAGLMAELATTGVRLDGSNPSGISYSVRSSSGYGNLMQEFNAGSSRTGSGRHESSTSRGGAGSSSSSSSLHRRRKSLRRVWQQVGGRVFSCGSSSGHMSGIMVEEMEHQRPSELPSAIADLSQLHRTATSCRGSSSHEAMAFSASSGDGDGDGGAVGAGPQRLDEDLVLDEAYWLSLAESIMERQRQEQARQVHNGCSSSSRDGDGDGDGDGASAGAGKNLGARHRCGDHSNSPASSSSSSSSSVPAAIMDRSADHESTNTAHSRESWSEAAQLTSRPWQKSEVQPWRQEGATYSELKIEEEEEEPSSSSSSLSSSSSSRRPEMMMNDCSASVLGASFDSSISNGVNYCKKKPWMTIKKMQMARSSLKQHCSGNGKETQWLPHHRLNTKLEESPCLLQSHHLQQRVAMAEGGGAGCSRSDNGSGSSSSSNSQSNAVEIRVRNQSNGGMDQNSHHHHHHQSCNNRDGAESSGAGGVDRMAEQRRGGAETLQPLERFLMLERADGQGSMEASASQKQEEEAAVAMAMAMAVEPSSAGGAGRTSLMALLHEEKEEEEEQHLQQQQPGMVSDREELSLQQKSEEEEEEEEDEGLEDEEDEEDEDEDEDGDGDGDEDEDQEGEEQKVKTKTKTKMKMKKKKTKTKKKKKKGRAMAMANDPLQCCVCMVGRRGAALIPCGHTFCRSCSKQLFTERGACPLCNNLIVQVLHIF